MDPATLVSAAALAVVGYLCGSIPTGVVVARMTGGPDPRAVGSGRTGGTNAIRALGVGRGLLVGFLDIGKGALPVLVARGLEAGSASDSRAVIEALAGIAAVVGASRSIFLGFAGGRGVAAGIGAMLVIDARVIAVSLPVFFGVILVTRYVSLGSLLASAVAVAALLLFVAIGGTNAIYLLYGVVAAILIWVSHADNIDRLLHGAERKFSLPPRDGS